MRATFVTEKNHDSATLVPESEILTERQSNGSASNLLIGVEPSIVRRLLGAGARFSIAVLIGVCATLLWQSFGKEAREMLSTQVPSLRWLSDATATSTLDSQAVAKKTAGPQSPSATGAAATAINPPELAQLEPIARDLAALRRSLEDLVAKQDQIGQSIATTQAATQEIKQKMSSRPPVQSVSDQPRKPPKPAHSSQTPQGASGTQSPAQ